MKAFTLNFMNAAFAILHLDAKSSLNIGIT